MWIPYNPSHILLACDVGVEVGHDEFASIGGVSGQNQTFPPD